MVDRSVCGAHLDGQTGVVPHSEIGNTVYWEFKILGAAIGSTVTRFQPGRHLSFPWSGGTTVDCRLVEHTLSLAQCRSSPSGCVTSRVIRRSAAQRANPSTAPTRDRKRS